ncbi:MAG: isochorismate synthase MenF [Candidatus Spyradosoma sp.]
MLRRFAFPPLTPEVFSALARAPAETKFLVENRSRGIAEMGLGELGADAPGKTFRAVSFDAAETFSLRPKWEISRYGNATAVVRNLADGEPDAPEILSAELDALLAHAVPAGTEKVPPIPPPREIGGEWYLPAARKILDEIGAGTLRKLVLSRAIEARAESPIPVAPILGKLHERFEKNCTIFCVARAGRTFLGASPETLVSLRGGALETEALAGSIPNFPGADVPALGARLLADDKERREHRAVIDFIAEKLRRLGAEPEFPDTPEIVVLPNILHLRTPIRARVPAGLGVLECVAALHPTPAMCGVPAEAARARILATEPFPRGNFAGPLGFFDARGEGFFAVGIRCAEVSGNAIRLFAGSGLVAGSVPEKEFREIDSKFAAVLSHIQGKA